MRKIISSFLVTVLTSGLIAQIPTARMRTSNMALIPGATFEMGRDEKDIPPLMELFKVTRAELFRDETPKHKVSIGSFYLDKTEVTNAEFKRFIIQSAQWQKNRIPPAYHNGKYLQHWNASDFPSGEDEHPVVFVSWYAAAAFCQSLGKRLPTEAEWEFAARGGLDGKEFPWGDELPDKKRANYFESELKKATAVASYPANGYGLYDMAGNAWEYLADEWQKYPVAADPLAIFRDRSFLDVKTRRSLRGGSYGGAPVNLRVTYRDSHLPGNAVGHVGFRCAMSSPTRSDAINELLRMHYRDRVAHFNRDAAYIFSNFADEFFNIGNGITSSPDREAGRKRMQAYFDDSTFLQWDDITPPIIHLSEDETLAYSIVNKRVRLLSKSRGPKEEIEVFAWTMTYRKIGGQWKITSVTSTRTPEVEK